MNQLLSYYTVAKEILSTSEKLTENNLINSLVNSDFSNITRFNRECLSNLKLHCQNNDSFNLGIIHRDLESEYHKILTHIPKDSLETYSYIVDELILSIYNYNSALYTFLNSNASDLPNNYLNLISKTRYFVDSIDNFDKHLKELVNYKSMLENTWDGINENNTLTIRLFRETITLSEITKYNECIEKMYSIICRGLDISSADSILLPVKVETGSLYEKLKGKEDAISLFISILALSYTIFHDNFSDISNLNNQVEQANFIKSKIEIVGLAKEQGIEISEESKKCLEDEITDLLNNSLTLAKNNTKIQINNTTLNLVPQEELLNFLSESTRPQIESSND